MTVWICVACGIEHANTARPPLRCAICTDERQYVPAGGQAWTSLQAMTGEYAGAFAELEPNLYALQVSPSFGIGQRGLLVRTPAGNVLWEPPGYVDQTMIDAATELGGVAAVAASHPHLVGCSITWSKAFDGVPVYYAEADQRWIRRPDDVVTLWSGRREILPGIELVQCGGHFPGSSVLHWRAGADRRGVLLVGDTMMVSGDRATVSFMRSYPNLIPLGERLVRQIAGAVTPLAFRPDLRCFPGSGDRHRCGRSRCRLRRSLHRLDPRRDPRSGRVIPAMMAEVGERFCIRYGCARRGHRTNAPTCPSCDYPTELVDGYLGSVPIAGEPDTAAIMEQAYRREPVLMAAHPTPGMALRTEQLIGGLIGCAVVVIIALGRAASKS